MTYSLPFRRLVAIAALGCAPFLLGNDGCGAKSITVVPCGTQGDVCGADEYCDAPNGGAASCLPRPTVCPQLYGPVCGSDGTTYANDCYAHAAGATVVSSGECASGMCTGPALGIPSMVCADGSIGGPVCTCTGATCTWTVRACPVSTSCGGFRGALCPKGSYCDYTLDASCGAADQTGTCKPLPTACTLEYAPVCGCDGQTYGNACQANMAGTSAATNGACPSTTCAPSDCGPAPASPLPYECLPDASGACTWQLACVLPPCAAPPPGCHYEAGAPCTCGTLVCTDCTLVDCAQTPPGCTRFDDGTCCGIVACPAAGSGSSGSGVAPAP